MIDDYDRDAVLAQVAERRRRNDEAVADLPQVSATDLMRARLGEQVARRAEQRGQLDFDGTATP